MAQAPVTAHLQPRDFALLRDLLESRVLKLSHVASLFFEGNHDLAKKRVAKLKSAGLIAERPRHKFEPSVLFLTRRAFQTLQEAGHLADYPDLGITALERRAQVSSRTIHHELGVVELKVALTKAVSEWPSLALRRISTWPRLFEFVASTVEGGFRTAPRPIQPDGFVLIENADHSMPSHCFFLELDRGTETLQYLVSRAVAYLDYYASGGFAIWRGRRPEEYRQHPFRVLGVFLSDKRKRNFALRLLQNNPPIRHQVYLASFADAVRDPLGAIWTCPADYAADQSVEAGVPLSRDIGEPAFRRALFSGIEKAEQS